MYIYIYIWVNYNDLTTTSLESWLVREIIPKWPQFRLVKYYNLPRYTQYLEGFPRGNTAFLIPLDHLFFPPPASMLMHVDQHMLLLKGSNMPSK